MTIRKWNAAQRIGLSAFLLLTLAGVSPGAQYEIKEMTPEVKTALENRRNRFDQLQAFETQGVLGENNRGYVDVLQHHPEARALAEVENKDRRTIYQTIAQQNNLTDALETIEKVFAEVQREKASPGKKIQREDGRWVTK